jgi:hypothetical protein
MNNSFFAILILTLSFVEAKTTFYDGYFSSKFLTGILPIWLEYSSDSNGLSARYFYKDHGQFIPLEASKTGNELTFKTKKQNAETFKLVPHQGRLEGTWTRGKSNYHVRLWPTDSAQIQYAHPPKIKELKVDSFPDQNLSQALEEFSNIGSPTTHFWGGRLIEWSFDWENCGAYCTNGTEIYLFDLKTHQAVDLWNEIDTSKIHDFVELFATEIKSQAKECRSVQSDDEWLAIFNNFSQGKEVNSKNLDSIFDFAPNAGKLSLEIDHIELRIPRVFNFPHVIQSLDCWITTSIELDKFRSYLKMDSFLHQAIWGSL